MKASTLAKCYSCDFETVNNLEDCRVWASCSVSIFDYNVEHLGTSIEEWFEWLFSHNGIKVYFHNLRFDGSFIVEFLLNHNWRHTTDRKDKTFSTIISDMGQWYSITIRKKINGRLKTYKIFDSLKKLPFTVKQIAKSFNLEESKGSIDYNMYRPVGYQLTDEEREYVITDCVIVAKALHAQFDEGLTRMTIASDAFNFYKDVAFRGHDFREVFPVIPQDWDDDIRKAYKGGFTYLNPKYANKRGAQGISYDVNSLYPSRMYYEKLPYGRPIKFTGKYKYDRRYPLYIINIECIFDLKEGYIPTIQIKNSLRFVPTEYIKSSEGDIINLWLTSVDFEIFKKHYNIDSLTYIGGYMFKASKGLFTSYIDYWMKIKETNTGARRTFAKLQLNSCYGRFATATQRASRIPNAGEDGFDLSEIKEQTVEPVYTALACFVTAYARNVTISSAQQLYGRFIYCDTDSLYLEGFTEPNNIDIHPTKLGAWKKEHTFTDSYFIRSKTYLITDNEEGIICKCAGMPDNIKEKVNYNNFVIGAKFDGKLIPKRVHGGVVLTETQFTIK